MKKLEKEKLQKKERVKYNINEGKNYLAEKCLFLDWLIGERESERERVRERERERERWRERE